MHDSPIDPHPTATVGRTPPPTAVLRGTRQSADRVAQYTLVREVGRGGMGVVYEAFDPTLRRPAAIKMLGPGSQSDPEAFARFRVEMEAAAAALHPNVVPVYEVGWHDGLPFVALEYLPGGTLHTRTAGKPQPPRWAADLVRAVAQGVQHAHAAGVIHRDLKPANILFAADGTPKVTDFGAARLLSADPDRPAVTQAGMVIGTPQYMSPEQARALAAGPAADVYSLGAVLYHLLTGRPPFDGPDPMEVMVQAVHTDPVRPRTLVPHVPWQLEVIALRCLDKEPARRYPSAAALADDLGRYLAGDSILARPDGPLTRLVKKARRKPLVTGLTAALVLALAAGTGGVAHQWQRTAAALQREELAREHEADARREADRRRQAAEANLYHSQLAQAAVMLRDDDTTRAAELLDQVGRSGQRGWEYEYLLGLTRTQLWTGTFDNGWPRLATVSPGGTWAVVTGGDPFGHPHLWDLAAPTQMHVFRANDGQPAGAWADVLPAGAVAAAWQSDDRLVLVGYDHPPGEGELMVLSLSDRRVLRGVRSAGVECGGPTVSADGRWAARGLPGERVELIDLATDAPPVTVAVPGCERVLAVHGPARLVVETKTGGRLVDPTAGTVVADLPRMHCPAVFSPDGTRLAARRYDGLGCWDARTGGVLWAEPDTDNREQLLFTADGERLVCKGYWVNPPRVRDAATGRVLCELRGHSAISHGVAVSPDGRLAATACGDGAVRLWDLFDGSERTRLRGHPTGCRAVAFDPTGSRLITGGMDGRVLAWDLTRERADGDNLPAVPPVHGCPGTLGGLWPLPDGRVRVLETGIGTLVDIDPATYTPLGTVKLDGLQGRMEGTFADFSLTPDGRYLAGPRAGDRGGLTVWDTSTGAAVGRWAEDRGLIFCTAVRADGGRVAACVRPYPDQPRRLLVADPHTGRLLRDDPLGEFTYISLTFLPDGRLAAGIASRGSADAGVDLIDPDGGPTVRLSMPAPSWVAHLAVSADGRRLAAADIGDSGGGSVRTWELPTGNLVWAVPTPIGRAGLGFSPDGRRLAAGRTTDTVQVYDADTGAQVLARTVRTARHGDPAFPARAVFTADGRRLVALHSSGSLSVWAAADASADADAAAADRRSEADAARYAAHLHVAGDHIRDPFGLAFRHHAHHLNTLPPPNPYLAERWAALRQRATRTAATAALTGGWAVGR